MSNLPNFLILYHYIVRYYSIVWRNKIHLYNIKRKNPRIESNHSFTLNRDWEATLCSNSSSSFFSLAVLFYAKNKRSCWKQSRCNSRNDRLHRIRGTQVAFWCAEEKPERKGRAKWILLLLHRPRRSASSWLIKECPSRVESRLVKEDDYRVDFNRNARVWIAVVEHRYTGGQAT